MTDYFALLDQPRRPWIDGEKLKQVFHEKTLRTHPDARAQGVDTNEAEAASAQINEAYQVLQDPKRRLHHLLSLGGWTPVATGDNIPNEVSEAFPTVAAATHEAERVVQKAAGATNPLSRSLVQPELLKARDRINAALHTLLRLRSEADAELQQLSSSFTDSHDNWHLGLHGLYLRFSYLTRWIDQLEEKRTQLSTC